MNKIVTKEEAMQMSVTLQSEGNSRSEKEISASGYWDKVIACIPAETISAYIIIQKAIEQAQDNIPYIVSYALIILMIIANVIYLLRLKSKLVLQHIIVNLAFLVWAYSLGDPFKHLLGENYQPLYATIGMVIIALFLPAIIDRNFFKK